MFDQFFAIEPGQFFINNRHKFSNLDIVHFNFFNFIDQTEQLFFANFLS